MLVMVGAAIDKPAWRGMTPLHYACERCHKEVVDYLIREAGCKVGES